MSDSAAVASTPLSHSVQRSLISRQPRSWRDPFHDYAACGCTAFSAACLPGYSNGQQVVLGSLFFGILMDFGKAVKLDSAPVAKMAEILK